MNRKQYLVPLLLLALAGILVLGITTQTQARGVNMANANIEAGIDAPAASGGAMAPTEIGARRAPDTVSRTYTLDVDFDEGVMINVNHDTPNNDQLQLAGGGHPTPFPFIWVSASSRGTVIKIDTATGNILGEYHTAPNSRGKSPSRTTVDMHGNVWVGNRNERSGGLGSAVHVGLKENSQCVDRNGNGVIDTSTGLGDIKAWPNTGGADNNGGVSTAEDECIIHYVRTSGTAVRHVSVEANNNVWIGGWTNRKFDLVDGATGAILRTSASFGCGGYGGLVDGNGVLWSARGGYKILRYDPVSDSGTCIGVSDSYGLGIDSQNNIWAATYSSSRLYKLDSNGNILGNWPTGGTRGRGVAVDASDNIWVANSSSDTVTRLDTSGNLLASIAVCNHPVGIAIDAVGKIWAPCRSSNNVVRINPATNQVDLTVDLGSGADPYTYSDMTGIVALGHTSPQGTWTVIYDSGKTGAPWGNVSWTNSPTGTVTVRVRSSELTTTLGSAAYVTVTNGAQINNLTHGRYIQVEVKLRPDAGGNSPIVYDVTVQGKSPGCRLTHDKTALPKAVPVGGAVTVTLSMQAVGDCTSADSPVDVILVIDRSGSMGGQKIIDAKAAAIVFGGKMTLPPDWVGVASFATSGKGSLDSGLTNVEADVTNAINGLIAGGMTDMKEGLEIAETELIAHGDPARAPVIIILSDGHHTESLSDLKAAADRIKAAGIRIISIGLGNANVAQLQAIASSTNDYYYAPNSAELADIYQKIAPTMWVAGRNMVLTDTMSSVATFIPGTFQGPISPTVSGDQLLWRIAAVPVQPVTLTYHVAMTSTPGTWDTNESAIATYIDSDGDDKILVFPKPQVVVPVRCEAPNISDIEPAWACVDDEIDPLAITGSGFIIITDFTVVTGTYDVDAYVSTQTLGIHNWTSKLINAVLPGNSGLGAGMHDVTVVNTCNLADVIPGSTSHPTDTVGPYVYEVYTGTLRDGLRLYPPPSILSIRPPEGYNDIPSEIVICGDEFAPGTEIFIKAPTGTIKLENQAAYGDTCLVGTIPADMPAGDYTILVKGSCGEATGTYRILAPGLNEDLWGLPEELRMVPSICARECDDIELGFVVHRRGGKVPIKVDVRFYEGNPALGATLIGTGTIPLMSPGVPVPPNWDNTSVISGVSTSLVDWTPSRGVSSYTLYAVLDPMNVISEDIEVNNVYSRTVQVLPCGPEIDQVAPHVDEFSIKGGVDVTYDVETPLSIDATDYPQPPPNSGISHVNIVEYLFNESALIWTPVQVSGWQLVSQTSSIDLHPEGGVRFFQAWASDKAGNISRFPNFKYINYIKECDYVSRNGVRIYRQHLEVGEKLGVEVAPCDSGSDPDLYIWPPDWATGDPPIVSNIPGDAVETLYISATVAGDYLIEVYGFTTSRYNINMEVEPAGALVARSRMMRTMSPQNDTRPSPSLHPSSTPRTDIVPVSPAPFTPIDVPEPATLEGVIISGVLTGSSGIEYIYTASVLPGYAGTVGWPITYTWQATGHEDMAVHASVGPTDTIAYTWNSPGTQAITVTVTDMVGSEPAIGYYGTVISGYNIYLPLALRDS